MTLPVFLMILLNITLLTAGQILWKTGLSRVEFSLSVSGILHMIFNPFIFGGLLIYVVATVVWFYVLSRAPLSAAYPMQSLCYVLAALSGLLFFHEPVSPLRWVGLGVIILGAFLVAKGG